MQAVVMSCKQLNNSVSDNFVFNIFLYFATGDYDALRYHGSVKNLSLPKNWITSKLGCFGSRLCGSDVFSTNQVFQSSQ